MHLQSGDLLFLFYIYSELFAYLSVFLFKTFGSFFFRRIVRKRDKASQVLNKEEKGKCRTV